MRGYGVFWAAMFGLGVLFKILKKTEVGALKYIFSLGLVLAHIHQSRFVGFHISLIPTLLLFDTTFIVIFFGPKVGAVMLPVSSAIYLGTISLELFGYLSWLSIFPDTIKFIDIFKNKTMTLSFFLFCVWFATVVSLVIIYITKLNNSKIKELAKQNEHIERLSRKLGFYLPKLLVKLLERGESEAEQRYERVRLTIFLSDIKDFTKLSDKLQPEETSKILNMYLTRMSKIAEEYGGTVDKFIGDAILVYFGGVGNERYQRNALQAVRMALAMQEEVKLLQDRFRREGYFSELPFQIRIGVNTGYATIGSFGSEERRDYTIIGKEVIVSSGLEAICEPGGVLVSHPTYLLTRDQIEYEDRGSISVKEMKTPLKTYKVIGEKPEHEIAGS
jgi:class 3 adenylate cyclase